MIIKLKLDNNLQMLLIIISELLGFVKKANFQGFAVFVKKIEVYYG